MNKAQLLELAEVDAAETKLRAERERYLRAHGWQHVVDGATSLWLWVKYLGPVRYTAATIETALSWQVRALDSGADPVQQPRQAADLANMPRAELELELGLAIDRAAQLAALVREALDLAPRMDDADPIAPALADWCGRARAIVGGAS